MLEEDATLLESTEGSQIMGSKCKKVVSRNKEGQWPSKKARKKQPEKYCEDAAVKMGGANPCERCVCAGQNCLVHHLR